MAKNPFQVAEQSPQIDLPNQGGVDARNALVQQGRAQSQAIIDIGRGAAQIANDIDKRQEDLDNTHWIRAMGEVKREFDRRKLLIANSTSIKKAQDQRDEFAKFLKNYVGSERESGIKVLPSERLRTKFIEEYSPLVKTQMGSVVDAKLIQIQETDRRVLYEDELTKMITGVTSFDDLQKVKPIMQKLIQANESVEQSKIVFEKAVKEASKTSVKNQADYWLDVDNVSLENVSKQAEIIEREVEEDYDFTPEEKTELKKYIDQKVTQVKTLFKAKKKMVEQAKEQQQEADEEAIWQGLNQVQLEPATVEQRAPEILQMIQTSSLSEKRKNFFFKRLESTLDVKIPPSKEAALTLLDDMYGAGKSPKELNEKLDELIYAGDINIVDAVAYRNRHRQKLSANHKTLMENFLQTQLDDKLTLGEEVEFGDITIEEDMSVGEYKKVKNQLQFFVREFLEANPNADMALLEKKFEFHIKEAIGAKGKRDVRTALLQYKRIADRKEAKLNLETQKELEERSNYQVEATLGGVNEERLRRWKDAAIKAKQKQERERRFGTGDK